MKKCTDAFMAIISGIEGVIYKRDDYELPGGESEENFLKIFNYFFNIKAQNLRELGTQLSDERRTITFDIQKQTENPSKITMTIENKETDQVLQADFYFKPGHGWVQVPLRNKKEALVKLPGETQKSILDPRELIKHYNLSQKARDLFAIEPDIQSFLISDSNAQISPSSYYSFAVDTDEEKIGLIKNIFKNNADKKEALDYAYHLYTQLSPDSQRFFLTDMAMADTHKSLKQFHEDIAKLLPLDKDFTSFYRNILFDTIKDTDPNNIEKNNKILEYLLTHGINPNSIDHNNNSSLYYAIAKNLEISELLLKHNADPNSGSTPPIFVAIYQSNTPGIDLLLRYNANINIINNGKTPLDKCDDMIKAEIYNPNPLFAQGFRNIRSKLISTGAKTSQKLFEESIKSQIPSQQEQSNRE